MADGGFKFEWVVYDVSLRSNSQQMSNGIIQSNAPQKTCKLGVFLRLVQHTGVIGLKWLKTKKVKK